MDGVLLRKRGSGSGYIKFYGRHEHRVVMEEHLGRSLSPNEVVHHKDGNPQNNDISNLELLSRSAHIAIHRDEMKRKRKAQHAPTNA